MASKKLASMSPEEREVERAKRRLYYHSDYSDGTTPIHC
jgi:hypothetical protein